MRWSIRARFGVLGLCGAIPLTQFNAVTDRVVVDFPALHVDGGAFRPLSVDDLVLRVDGRERAINTLELVTVGDFNTSGQSLAPQSIITTHRPGRSILFVVDQDAVWPGAEKQALRAASRFVDSLSSDDDFSLASLPHGPSGNSLSKADITRAFAAVVGRAPTQRDECDAAPASRYAVQQLTTLLRSRKRTDGPSVVIFISGGLLPPVSGAEPRIRSNPCSALRPSTVDFGEIGKVANELRLQTFVIQPDVFADDVSRRAPPDRHQADELLFGLETLTGAMGGQMFRLSGQADTVFARIRRETSAYYLLSFEPTSTERDGKTHKIDVRVKSSKEKLRARQSFMIPVKRTQ